MASTVLGAGVGGARAAGSSLHAVLPAAASATSWPEFHGDPARTGVSSSVAPAGSVLYTVNLANTLGRTPANPLGNDYPYQASPSTDGTTVAVALDNIVVGLSASTGAVDWQRTLPGGNGSGPIVATPLWSNGEIYIDQDGGPNDLVALSGSNGTISWSLQPPGGGNPEASSVADAAGVLAVTDLNGGFFLHPMSAGAPWTSAVTPRPASYYATPSFAVVVGGGPTLVVPDRGNRSLDAFSLSGTMLPGFPLAPRQQLDRLYSSAAVVNLTDPAGGAASTWAIFGGEGGAGNPSHLYAVDLSQPSGILALTVPAPGSGDSGVRGTPTVVVSGGVASIYFGTRAGAVSRVDFSPFGASLTPWTWIWNQSTAGPIDASTVVVGSEVLAPSEDGTLYAFALTNGALLWKVLSGAPLYASPAVAGGTCWIINANGVLTAIGGVLPGSPNGGNNPPAAGTSSTNPLLWAGIGALATIAVVAVLLLLYVRRRRQHRTAPASGGPAASAEPAPASSTAATWAPDPKTTSAPPSTAPPSKGDTASPSTAAGGDWKEGS